MKIDAWQEQSRLSQERAIAAMTNAQKKSEENLRAELNNLGQQVRSKMKLISEDVFMLTTIMHEMTLESRSNHDKRERELDGLGIGSPMKKRKMVMFL